MKYKKKKRGQNTDENMRRTITPGRFFSIITSHKVFFVHIKHILLCDFTIISECKRRTRVMCHKSVPKQQVSHNRISVIQSGWQLSYSLIAHYSRSLCVNAAAKPRHTEKHTYPDKQPLLHSPTSDTIVLFIYILFIRLMWTLLFRLQPGGTSPWNTHAAIFSTQNTCFLLFY